MGTLRPDTPPADSFTQPLYTVETSGYRPPHRPNHRGRDSGSYPPNPTIAGKPQRAPYSGNVSIGYELGGAGNYYNIYHDNGTLLYKSFHLSSYATYNPRIEAGQTFGYTGNTGASSGAHAHEETWQIQNGVWVDCNPTGWLEAARARELAGGHPTPPPTPDPPPPTIPTDPEDDDMIPYTQWADEDRWALAKDVAGVVGDGAEMPENFIALNDIGGMQISGLVATIDFIAEALGVDVEWVEGHPKPVART